MHPADIATDTATSMSPVPEGSNRLEPMLLRLPRPLAAELRNLAPRTLGRQSDYLREAVADLLAKYGRRAGGSTM
jgi:hypothetical protein